MVGLPFFFMIFAVLELGLVFLIDSTLESAINRASRIVRTGQADMQGITNAQFKTALCSQMTVFENDCQRRADVDVRVMTGFSEEPPQSPIEDGVLVQDNLAYDIGQPGDLILVRVWYSQPLVTPFMSQAVSRLKSGAMLITVTTAFRNEPYRGRAT